jgi:hypothetical protein
VNIPDTPLTVMFNHWLTDANDTFWAPIPSNLNIHLPGNGDNFSGLTTMLVDSFKYEKFPVHSGVVIDEYTPPAGLKVVPNPASASSSLDYFLGEESSVTITIYDVLGSIVATPVMGEMESVGQHETTFNTKELPPGIYTCRLSAGDAEMLAKMVVVR